MQHLGQFTCALQILSQRACPERSISAALGGRESECIPRRCPRRALPRPLSDTPVPGREKC